MHDAARKVVGRPRSLQSETPSASIRNDADRRASRFEPKRAPVAFTARRDAVAVRDPPRERATGQVRGPRSFDSVLEMIIGLFLPHVGIFGGVRRYIELGNAWTALGHRVTLYHPDGTRPAWLPFAGEVGTLESSARRESDAAICSDPHTYPAFRAHRAATHLYYCVLERDPGLSRAARDRDVLLAANYTPLRRRIAALTRRHLLDGAGGINLTQFHPDPRRRGAAPPAGLVQRPRAPAPKGGDRLV